MACWPLRHGCLLVWRRAFPARSCARRLLLRKIRQRAGRPPAPHEYSCQEGAAARLRTVCPTACQTCLMGLPARSASRIARHIHAPHCVNTAA